MTIAFDPENKEHKAIVVSAMATADVFGLSRITSAKEMLTLCDIAIADDRIFEAAAYTWGKEMIKDL